MPTGLQNTSIVVHVPYIYWLSVEDPFFGPRNYRPALHCWRPKRNLSSPDAQTNRYYGFHRYFKTLMFLKITQLESTKTISALYRGQLHFRDSSTSNMSEYVIITYEIKLTRSSFRKSSVLPWRTSLFASRKQRQVSHSINTESE